MKSTIIFAVLLMANGETTSKPPLSSLWIYDGFPAYPDLKFKKGEPWKEAAENTHVQIANLDAIYSDSFSEMKSLNQLRILYTQLKVIEPGAFGAAPALKELELDLRWNPHPLTLTKETFKNCQKLEKLSLTIDEEKANSVTLEEDALEDLVNLKELSISGFKIPRITKKLLKNKNSLIDLYLHNCYVESVENDAFEGSKSLESLDISGNKNLRKLSPGLFKDLTKLERLQLGGNSLKDLSWDEFQDSKSVKFLNLSENQISSFDAEKIVRNFPKLEALAVEKNPLPCEELEKFAGSLKEKYGREVEVTFLEGYKTSSCAVKDKN